MRKFGIDFTRSRTITYAIIYRFSNKFCMRLNNEIAGRLDAYCFCGTENIYPILEMCKFIFWHFRDCGCLSRFSTDHCI